VDGRPATDLLSPSRAFLQDLFFRPQVCGTSSPPIFENRLSLPVMCRNPLAVNVGDVPVLYIHRQTAWRSTLLGRRNLSSRWVPGSTSSMPSSRSGGTIFLVCVRRGRNDFGGDAGKDVPRALRSGRGLEFRIGTETGILTLDERTHLGRAVTLDRTDAEFLFETHRTDRRAFFSHRPRSTSRQFELFPQ